MKDKNLQPRSLYPARISFKYEEEIKSFTDKRKLRECNTTKPALQQMLKDLLQKGNTEKVYKLESKTTSKWQNDHTHQSVQFSSVNFSCSVLYDSLRPQGLQQARPPCPSRTPRIYSNSCPLSQFFHSTTSFSVVPFSSLHQSFPASKSFQMSKLFASGGQSIGVSASTSVLPMNIQDRFPLG